MQYLSPVGSVYMVSFLVSKLSVCPFAGKSWVVLSTAVSSDESLPLEFSVPFMKYSNLVGHVVPPGAIDGKNPVSEQTCF